MANSIYGTFTRPHPSMVAGLSKPTLADELEHINATNTKNVTFVVKRVTKVGVQVYEIPIPFSGKAVGMSLNISSNNKDVVYPVEAVIECYDGTNWSEVSKCSITAGLFAESTASFQVEAGNLLRLNVLSGETLEGLVAISTIMI